MINYNNNGNVLFLILIAVALFAALSYAVTNSGRSGGNNGSREVNKLSIAQIRQYGSAVRIGTMRQIMDGVDPLNLKFNRPDDFANCPTNRQCVYHPEGGGVNYALAPADIMADGVAKNYFFSMDHYIEGVGSPRINNTVEAKSHLIMSLLGITQEACEEINKDNGISSPVPVAIIPVGSIVAGDMTAMAKAYMDHTYTASTTSIVDIGYSDATEVSGHSEGCIDLSGFSYAYYQVIVER